VGETREADIFEAQFGNKIGRAVSRFPTRSVVSSSEIDRSQLEALQYKPAIALIDTLLTELKRLDDKMLLTEVHLLESRVYRGIGNLAKSKVYIPLEVRLSH